MINSNLGRFYFALFSYSTSVTDGRQPWQH